MDLRIQLMHVISVLVVDLIFVIHEVLVLFGGAENWIALRRVLVEFGYLGLHKCDVAAVALPFLKIDQLLLQLFPLGCNLRKLFFPLRLNPIFL